MNTTAELVLLIVNVRAKKCFKMKLKTFLKKDHKQKHQISSAVVVRLPQHGHFKMLFH